MTEFSAKPINDARPVGISLLALMTSLVSLLALMLSFSLLLRSVMPGAHGGDASLTLMSGLAIFGMAYAVQAWALWTLRRWTRAFALALLALVTVAGLVESGRNDVMALGTMLVFGLAFLTSLVLLLALHPRHIRRHFSA